MSRWFRNIIDGSVLLQYLIECYLAGVVDNPARSESVHERLQTIREWRAAIQHPQWTATSRKVSLPQHWHEPLVQVFGSAYVIWEEDKITIVQPPSKIKGRVEKRWVLNTGGLRFRPCELAYDHNEKVLALVECLCVSGFASHS